jgi:hypothetical protein
MSRPFALCCLTLAGLFVPLLQADHLVRLQYNHPGLVVDLGVGLWAFPLPMDFDGDGDLDWPIARSPATTPVRPRSIGTPTASST